MASTSRQRDIHLNLHVKPIVDQRGIQSQEEVNHFFSSLSPDPIKRMYDLIFFLFQLNRRYYGHMVFQILPLKYQKSVDINTASDVRPMTWKYDERRLQEEFKRCAIRLREREEKTHYLEGFCPNDSRESALYTSLPIDERIKNYSMQSKTDYIDPVSKAFELMTAPPYTNYSAFKDAIASITKTNKIAYRIAARYLTEFFKVLYCTPAVWKSETVEAKREIVAESKVTTPEKDFHHLISNGKIDEIKQFVEKQDASFVSCAYRAQNGRLLYLALERKEEDEDVIRYLVDKICSVDAITFYSKLCIPNFNSSNSKHLWTLAYAQRKFLTALLNSWKTSNPTNFSIDSLTRQTEVDVMRKTISGSILERDSAVNTLFLQTIFLICWRATKIAYLLLGFIEQQLGGNIKKIQTLREQLQPEEKALRKESLARTKLVHSSTLFHQYRTQSITSEKLNNFETRLHHLLQHFPKIKKKIPALRTSFSRNIFNFEELHSLLAKALEIKESGPRIVVVILYEYISLFKKEDEPNLEIEVIPLEAPIARTSSSPLKIAKKISAATTTITPTAEEKPTTPETTTTATVTATPSHVASVEEKQPVRTEHLPIPSPLPHPVEEKVLAVVAPPPIETTPPIDKTATTTTIAATPIKEEKQIIKFEIPTDPPPLNTVDNEEYLEFVNSVRALNESKQTQQDLQAALNKFIIFRYLLLPDAASLTNRDIRSPMTEYIHSLEKMYAVRIVSLQAQHYLQTGGTPNIEKAIAKWDMARRLNPADHRFEMAMIKNLDHLAQTEDLDKRKKLHESIVEICEYFLAKSFPPDTLTVLEGADIYLAYATALTGLDRKKEAQDAYHKVLEFNPDCSTAKDALTKLEAAQSNEIKEPQESKLPASSVRTSFFPLPLGPEDTTQESLAKARNYLEQAKNHSVTEPYRYTKLQESIEHFENAHNNLITKLGFLEEGSDLHKQIQTFCYENIAVWKAEAVLLYIQNDDISIANPAKLFERQATIWRALRYTADDNMNITFQQLRLELLRTHFRKLAFETPKYPETIIKLSQRLEKLCNKEMMPFLSPAKWSSLFHDCAIALKEIEHPNYQKWQEQAETREVVTNNWTIVRYHRKRALLNGKNAKKSDVTMQVCPHR